MDLQNIRSFGILSLFILFSSTTVLAVGFNVSNTVEQSEIIPQNYDDHFFKAFVYFNLIPRGTSTLAIKYCTKSDTLLIDCPPIHTMQKNISTTFPAKSSIEPLVQGGNYAISVEAIGISGQTIAQASTVAIIPAVKVTEIKDLGQSVRITFVSIPGQSYTLQSTIIYDNEMIWADHPDAYDASTEGYLTTITVTKNPMPRGKEFFRLRQGPPPLPSSQQ